MKTIIMIAIVALAVLSVGWNISCGIKYWDMPYMEVPYKCRMFMKQYAPTQQPRRTHAISPLQREANPLQGKAFSRERNPLIKYCGELLQNEEDGRDGDIHLANDILIQWQKVTHHNVKRKRNFQDKRL